jgi:hypothetical protein
MKMEWLLNKSESPVLQCLRKLPVYTMARRLEINSEATEPGKEVVNK